MLPNWLYGKSKTKLANILGGTPEDYDQVKAQVTQNAQDTTALFDNTEVNGAVNMLPNTATTQTLNGVTFTVNSDRSVTANGTATANTWMYILGTGSSDYKMLPNIVGKAVKLTGCPSGGGNQTYYLKLMERTPTYIGHEEYGDGTTFTVQNGLTGCNCYIYIAEGQTVSNLTFKPMLTVASYTGPYVPYAKSNKELADEKLDISSLKTITATSSDFADFKTRIAAL